jgi:hypothetical protein
MAVVQKLANVRPATAHLFEPRESQRPQRVIGLGKPAVDGGVSPDGARKPHQLAHRTSLPGLLAVSIRRASLADMSPPKQKAAAGVTRGGFLQSIS